jgi:uncharacterized protein
MKYTLITGASRGIGEAMAEYCASKKMNLILTARSRHKLEKIAANLINKYGINVKTYGADLTDSQAIANMYKWCQYNELEVNMLINNAGNGMYGQFGDLPLEEQLGLIQLNQTATISMIHAFIPMLKKQEEAYILNVASTACYQPIPYMSVYAATQAFLQSFTLALRHELKNYRIYVSCVCPGPTATDFFERAGLERLPVNSSEVKMPPEEVAEIAIEGMLDKESEIIPGTSNTFGAYFSKLFPNKFVIKTISGLFAPKT